jgi:ATP-dependent DNA helicase RecG
MTTLENQDMAYLLQEGDSDRVEFKSALSGNMRNEIQEAICAFSNDLPDHREPGVIFVGVHDDGSIAGLPVADELLRQLAGMKTEGNIVPPPTMTVEKMTLDGGDMAVVAVYPSDSPPVRYRGRIHVRIGPRRGTATAQDERILNEKRRYRDKPFDIHPMPSATLSDLNLPYFELEYLPQAFDREALAANDRSIEERLAATKMITAIDDATPTVLGVLTLGKNPQDFLPCAYVQFLKFNGSKLSDDISDSEDIRGAIPDVIRHLDEKLNAHNQTAVDILSAPIERRRSTYPIQAIQQLTRNAIMHRTYEATNAPTKVHWFNDRIEIISPGGPFGEVSAANFGRPGLADYRNPNLADVMRTLGFVQHYGVGISIARRLLEEAGHPEPEFDILENYIFATMKAAA